MRQWRRHQIGGLALCLPLALAGCVGGEGAPPATPDALPPIAQAEPDAQTRAALAYYRKIEDFYLSTDRLRTDRGGKDAPFGATDLARNFLAIAFFEEFSGKGGMLVARPREVRLQRWTAPVRIGISFGPSVPEDQRRKDRAEVAALAMRLATLTGLPVRLTEADPNFLVLIENPTDRPTIGQRIRGFLPGVSTPAVQSAAMIKADVYCTVLSSTPGRSGAYDRALAVIRGELPELLRQSCLHEEIVQGFGLLNDSPRARPSIFNDDAEYALLTRQDELMLRILYDPRLKPGMTLAEARPIVETIAAELLPGES